MVNINISQEISNLFSCLSKTYKFKGSQARDISNLIANLIDAFCSYHFNLFLNDGDYSIYILDYNQCNPELETKSVNLNLSQVSEDYISMFLKHNWRVVKDVTNVCDFRLEDVAIGIAVYQATKDLEFEGKRNAFKVLPFGKKNQSKNFVIRLFRVSGELPCLRYPYYYVGTMHQWSLKVIFSTFQKQIKSNGVESEPLVSEEGLLAMQHQLDVEEPLDCLLSKLYSCESLGMKITDDSDLKLSIPTLGGEHEGR